MLDRDQNILDAALVVFARYGVKKSSMADIAEEAGIARQTLYKSFRNKDDVLRAHIRAYADRAVAEIEAKLEEIEGLGPKLDVIFDKIAVAGFDMVQAVPNAQDVEDGFEDGSRAELACNAERFKAVIAKVLTPHAVALQSAGMTPEQLAEYVQRSARAAKGYAQSREHLLEQLETLRKLCQVASKCQKP